jgi:hypothetical protein
LELLRWTCVFLKELYLYQNGVGLKSHLKWWTMRKNWDVNVNRYNECVIMCCFNV